MNSLLFVLVPALMLQSSSTESVGHRGAPHFAPENTIASFKKAIALGADFLEADIQQTKDGHLIIMHDATVDRTTNGKGKVKDLTLQELKELDAGSWFSPEYAGEHVPTLGELLELSVEDGGIRFILELKQGNDAIPGIEELLIAEIKEHGLEERVWLKSFSWRCLQRLRILAPQIPQVYVFVTAIPLLDITIAKGPRFHDPLKLPVEYLQPHGSFTRGRFIRKAHKEGKKVIVWGVEREASMQCWIDHKADGVETDRLNILSSISQDK